MSEYPTSAIREGKGREGKGREGKGREGKGREGREGKGKGREGKGREGKGREGKGREGKGREGKGKEGKGRKGKQRRRGGIPNMRPASIGETAMARTTQSGKSSEHNSSCPKLFTSLLKICGTSTEIFPWRGTKTSGSWSGLFSFSGTTGGVGRGSGGGVTNSGALGGGGEVTPFWVAPEPESFLVSSEFRFVALFLRLGVGSIRYDVNLISK
jgi:hypothetical protein